MPPQIVGRRIELENLDRVLGALGEGRAACLAVEGEPGIGKSHLLAELRRRAADRGHAALAGAAAEFERDLPFAVWTDALGSAWPEGGEPIADERYRTHRAMRALLETLAAEQPLVVVLDDLHWADQASLELIGALVHREPDAPVLLALGCRTGRVPDAITAALAAPIVQRIVLGPLDPGESAELAAELAPTDREAIFADSGGNPFYVLQLARTAGRSSGGLPGSGIPDVVAAALLEELRQLSTPARLLLEAGAVAGDPVEPELAMAIAALDHAAGLDALDELLDADLLRATPVPRLFAFRHPLVRRAVYAASKGGWRIGAHARAADALASYGASVVARAHHVERSARVGDADAVAVLLEAAQASMRTSPSGAARWYEAALRVTPEVDVPARLGLLAMLATAQRAAGEPARCLETLQQALALGPDLGLELQLIAGCAACEVFLGRYDAAEARLERALKRLPDERSPEAAALLFHLAAVSWFTTRMERMQEMARRSLDVAEEVGDNGLIGAAAAALALALSVLGQLDEAEPHRVRAADLLHDLTDAELVMRLEALTYLGWAEFYLERFEDACRHITRGLAVARASGAGAFIPFMEECQCLSELLLGRFEAGEALRENAIEAARLAGVDAVTATALASSSIALAIQGDSEAARRDAVEAIDRVGEDRLGFIAGLAGAAQLLSTVETDLTAEPPGAVVAAAGGWELSLLPLGWRVAFHERLTEALLAAGGTARAEACATLASKGAEALGLTLSRALALHARAAVQLASGDAEAAAQSALESMALAEQVGTPIETARSRAVAGEALAVAGDRDAGVAHLLAAEAELDRCGALKSRNLARRALRRFGARSEPRGPSAAGEVGLGSLSSREREVAELVTDRKTNREIAAELFLSEKTIESHLRNIFFKLDVSSRKDVARVVETARSAV